ncbi:MAG: PDZ domain-containing protein [Thermoguttaceae bacterium]|nr:PDZ domain-containing protein [Thermoguttaceae bacterium]
MLDLELLGARLFGIAVGLWLAAGACAGESPAAKPDGAKSQPSASAPSEDLEFLEQKAFQAAVQRVAPSVVMIETIGGLEKVGQVLFGTGPTTGLVVDPQGYIVSSAFNFVNKPSSILVRLPDGTRKAAKLVANDTNRMISLLKIEVDKPLPVPEAVPRSQMRVGQWAIAVGRAFGEQHPNITVGIVSAVNRIWGKAIQTDAAVSPNNYGGPLVDIHGRVLGILAPLSPQGGSEIAGVEWYDSGIGFAIPLEDILQALPRLKEGKDLKPGLLGIQFKNPALHISEPEIGSCRPNSPAAKAGLKAGDKIIQVGDRPITRAAEVKEEISRRYAGDKLRLVALRGKDRIECEVELVAEIAPYVRPFLGILPIRSQPGQQPTGVLVRYVYPDSPAAKAGLQPGDLLLRFAGQEVKDLASFRQLVADHQPKETLELVFRRNSQEQKVQVTLAPLPEAVPAGPLPPARLAATSQPVPEGLKRGIVELKVPEMPHEVWAYVPDSYDPAVSYGVVFWLHGRAAIEPKEILSRWKPLCDAYDLILVVPKAVHGTPPQWQPGEIELVKKLLENLRTGYHVDPHRVVAVGDGAGAGFAGMLAFGHREAIRAVVMLCPEPILLASPENDPAYPLWFYVARPEKDQRTGQVDAFVGRLRAAKYPVIVKNLGEKQRELTAEEMAELLRWIDALDQI